MGLASVARERSTQNTKQDYFHSSENLSEAQRRHVAAPSIPRWTLEMAGWRGQEVAGLLDEGITGDPGEPRPNLSWPLHHQLAGGSTGGWGGVDHPSRGLTTE
jgi:hypothetical protein